MNALMKVMAPWIFSALALAPLAVTAGELKPVRSDTSPAAVSRPEILPGTGFAVRPDTFAAGLGPDHSKAVLSKIATWLSSEFDLPSTDEPPVVTFVSARRIASLRYRDVPSDRWSDGVAYLNRLGEQPDVLAVYDDEARTIYLPVGWSGKTPGELSVLVHEMVHHIQNMAGLKFACPEEREKMAFEVQEKWLSLYGSNLETEFELDPFTLLARTNCLY